MSDSPRILRIFISSPGDVIEERQQARRVIEGLQKRYPDVTLQPVLWEDLALPATASFQETIDLILHQSPIDIAVFILWSRLGSPLGTSVSRPDGTPYRSGTEREFDLMLTAFEQSSSSVQRGAGVQPARPIILAYTRDDDSGFQRRLTQTPINDIEELLSQRKLAEVFIREQFHDGEGHNRRAYQTYTDPPSFADRLRVHLHQALDNLLGVEAAPRWQSEPYRGLAAFDIPHADIFRGRDEETCDLRQRLRDQARIGCAFAVIVGASGSGKSSLARAGIAASLLQHASDDGIKEWRAAFLLPGLDVPGSRTRESSDAAPSNQSTDANRNRSLTTSATTAVSSILVRLTHTVMASIPELRTSPTALDDIAAGLAQDAALTIRLSLAPAFARAAEQAKEAVRLLLVIDQMEELWTDRDITPEDRDRFFAAIEALARSGHVTVLATLRSDFYAEAQKAPAFLRLKGERGHFDLLPPSPASLQRLITEPARLAGVRFERDEQLGRSLDEVILQDAARDPGALPLLQYALSELYQHCIESFNRTPQARASHDQPSSMADARACGVRLNEQRLLTFAAYEKLGGVEGALGQRAEEIFQQLPAAAQSALNELLPLLVTIDVTGEQSPVRRRALLTDLTATQTNPKRQRGTDAPSPGESLLATPPCNPKRQRGTNYPTSSESPLADASGYISEPPTARQTLLTALIQARFLTTDREGESAIASLAHEALLRRWDRLATWITANREHLRLRARAEHSQQRWVQQGRDDSLLLPNGLPLEEGQLLLREARPLLTSETIHYIHQSLDHHTHQAKRTRRVRQTVLTILSALTLAASLGGLFAWQKQREAKEQRDIAESKAKEANIARRNTTRLAAETSLRTAGTAIEHLHEVSDGVLWYAEGLRIVEDTSSTARRSARSLIGAWSASLPQKLLWHESPVDQISFSSDSRSLATFTGNFLHRQSGLAGEFRLWDVEAGQPRGEPLNHSGCSDVSFSPDGSTFATTNDNTIQLWDVQNGQPRGNALQHHGHVDAASFSPDGSTLVTQSGDSVRLWDVATGNLRGEPLRHGEKILGMSFSFDSNTLATRSMNSARLWNVASGRLHGEPLKHEDGGFALSFTPDGRTLATLGRNSARLWDVATSQLRGKPLVHGDDDFLAASFSPDGRTLATRSGNSVRLWDVVAGQPRGEPLMHDHIVSVMSISPDGRTLATVADKIAHLWDVATAQPRGEPLKLDDYASGYSGYGLSFVANGRELLTMTHNTACLWDALTGQARRRPLKFDGEGEIDEMLLSPDGKLLATRRDNVVQVWEVDTGQPRSEPFKLYDHTRSMSFSPDGRLISAGDGLREVRGMAYLWRVDAGRPRNDLLKHEGHVNVLQFSPDGRVLATASGGIDGPFSTGKGGTVRLWDVQTGKAHGELLTHDASVNAIIFSPDGNTIATASGDFLKSGEARLWDAKTGRPRGEPLKHGHRVNAVSFSPDGSTIATASGDDFLKSGEARLWDAKTGHPRGEPFKHNHRVNAVSFSPDGSTIATASGDVLNDSSTGEARLWDAKTGHPLGEAIKTNHSVKVVSFSPDGGTLVTASGDSGEVQRWDVPSERSIGDAMKCDNHVMFSPDGHWIAAWPSRTPHFTHQNDFRRKTTAVRTWRLPHLQSGPTLSQNGEVHAVGFSPNGQMIATASDDNTLRLWDVETGLPCGEPLKHDGAVWVVSFSPDGHTLATAGGNKVRLWDVPLPVVDDPERV
jgi:WD40 repeat protein